MDDEFFGGLMMGIFFSTFACFLWWLSWSGVKITDDGKYYIQTHNNIYQLVSDKPVKIRTSLKE
jgi:hypothetical protein